MEHRYFGDSLPVEIDYKDNETWKYLTTEQAAADAHDVVAAFKTILTGKWLSTGASKSGMTTEMYAYYYPNEMDLYVPYVAPFCNSRSDTRMMKFIYEEAGNQQYGPNRAKEIRNEVLNFQVKMLEYRDTLATKFYNSGTNKKVKYSAYATKDILFDVAVLEFGIGFWQYYQNKQRLETVLAMPETTQTELSKKRNDFYTFFTSVITPSDLSINNEFTPYFVQAYQELGNYGYDFSYIRNALTENAHLVITEEEELDAAFKMSLTQEQLKLEQKELMYTNINEMLQTTDMQFVLIYGSSDPWYSVRPDDVTRDNIYIAVNTNYPHTANISNFDSDKKVEILNRIKSILD